MDKLLSEIPLWAFVISFLIILLAVIALVVKWAGKVARRRLEPLATALGGGEIKGGFFSGTYIRLFNYDPEVRIEFERGGENEPRKLILRQVSLLDFNLDISKESRLTSTLRRIGLHLDFKVGDPLFDEKYLLISSQPVASKNFLLSGSRRESVDYFFHNGFTRLSTDEISVSAEKENYTKQDLDPNKIRNHLDQLKKFVSG